MTDGAQAMSVLAVALGRGRMTDGAHAMRVCDGGGIVWQG